MNYSLTLERHLNNGNLNMKTLDHNMNPLKKESNLNTIVDQLCIKLKDIKDQEEDLSIGMQKNCLEQTDAVRKYYAAFPALNKGEQSAIHYYLPPPAWCKKSLDESNFVNNMQCDLSETSKGWNNRKKFSSWKERRNSYNGQKKNKNKKRYSRSFKTEEDLPEWVTHEGVWDMETQDPVKEFIRAIAFDEGYGTCENTVTDDLKMIPQINLSSLVKNDKMVPEWEDSLNFDSEWILKDDLKPQETSPTEEMWYSNFKNKFDRNIKALWDDTNTPDDEFQDLPIDFEELLSSPSDQQFYDVISEKSNLLPDTENIWSNDKFESILNNKQTEASNRSVDILHDQFKPLNLTDDSSSNESKVPIHKGEPYSIYGYDDGLRNEMSCAADIMRSLITLNHSKGSSFVEVIPRRYTQERMPYVEVFSRPIGRGNVESDENRDTDSEDLLTSSRTHFRPIRKEAETEKSSAAPVRYADGATFEIDGALDPVEFRRSESGFEYVDGEAESERYLEYRSGDTIDYRRLELTAAQRAAAGDLEERPGLRLRFAVRGRERGVQADERPRLEAAAALWLCDECARLAGAKKKRPSARARASIWAAAAGDCEACAAPVPAPAPASASAAPSLVLSAADWDELMSDISAAAATAAAATADAWRADRKRRHSAALRCARPHAPCSHPHAPFLHCCALDRPLTR